MTTAEYLGALEPGTPAWAVAREGALGGSEIAAVMGLSPWESAFSLWHRKTGHAGPVADRPELEWGRRLEPAVIGKFADDHPVKVGHAGTWRSVERPWQIASPDAFVWTDNGVAPLHELDPGRPLSIFEAKTAHDPLGWGEPGTNQIPVYYRTQGLWYLDALGLDRCHLGVLIRGMDYREYIITTADAGVHDDLVLMREAAIAFLATVARGERPPIDEHDATYAMVRELHPDIDPVDVDIPANVAEAYLTALADAKAAARHKQRATATLADAMGTARRALYAGEPIAIRVPGRANDGPPYVRAARPAAEKVSTP